MAVASSALYASASAVPGSLLRCEPGEAGYRLQGDLMPLMVVAEGATGECHFDARQASPNDKLAAASLGFSERVPGITELASGT